MNLQDKIAYDRAKKKVKEIRSFYYSLACYCIVIPVLIYINLTYSPEFHWFWFSVCGWGLGLTLHGMGAFNINPFINDAWEDRKIREFIEAEERKQQSTNKFK